MVMCKRKNGYSTAIRNIDYSISISDKMYNLVDLFMAIITIKIKIDRCHYTKQYTLVHKESHVGDENDRTPSSREQFVPIYPSHRATMLVFLGR